MARNSDYQTVHTEGGLLPSDQLLRVAAGKADLTKPTDYDLPPGEKVNEAISQSWARLCKHWADFQATRESIPGDQPGTDITNQKWLLPLFRELGYGKLTTSKSLEIDGKTYPITRFHGHLPIHFVGCNIKLDKRSPGVKGAATSTPHGLVQEFLNRSDDHLWAFVTNGRQFRILRDNVALSRQSYIEFDLEGMFDGEVYSDFALLWMVCHVTRTEGDRPELCCLEKWSAAARDHGTRVLENLRNGVERSIEALGRGFVSHPANDTLRQKLSSGGLDKQALYHQVLRNVYRLLFLFVAEDRDLLHTPDTTDEARELYDEHYSTRRLRNMAGQIKGSRHGDLWHVLSLTFAAVSGEESAEAIRTHLGLPALGSRLWRIDETPDILGPSPACPACPEPAEGSLSDRVQLSNDDLLEAIRHLAYVQQEHTLQAVNYRDLGSEELGSVYESLLELQPEIHAEARQFELKTVTGSERKTTGSYYTPDSLVQCLLDSALEPVIKDRLDEAAGNEAQQQAILDLTVCDPACGSGHFLIGAAHRLARHLSRLRAAAQGEAEPTPDVYQHALRDVIAHCIYGVDINPMAVELCKVSLWLEAIDPGRPLAFLDHHIQCGNSLLGTTPALIAKGIPDSAFKPIEGDDKEACKQLKAENKTERKGQRRLWGAMPNIHLGNMAQTFANIDAEDDSTPDAVALKEKHYQEFVSSSAYENARFLADAWCAAFVWEKTDPMAPAVTTETIRRIEDNPYEYPPGSPIREGVRRLASQYQFFHWHLVFPDVFHIPAEGEQPENDQAGWSGGFDCVLGNPPWERIKLQEKEFFATRNSMIASAPNAAKRRQRIKELTESDPELLAMFLQAKRHSEGAGHFLRTSGTYPLCGRGDVNTYAVFAELKRSMLAAGGRVGCIVPSGIATDSTTQMFFRDLMESRSLASLYDFENRNAIFHGVHRSYKFCLLTLTSPLVGASCSNDFAFFALDVSDLNQKGKRFSLSAEDVALLNPNTHTCPIFRSQEDAELTKRIYRRVPALVNDAGGEEGNQWGLRYTEMFHSAHDSAQFMPNDAEPADPEQVLLPYYEAKQMFHYDHRWASFDGAELVSPSRVDPYAIAKGRHCVPREYVWPKLESRWPYRWRFCWRDVTANTNERTVVAGIIPEVVTSDKLPVGALSGSEEAHNLVASFTSFVVDYAARQKMGGTLKFHIVKQLPVFGPSRFEEECPWGTLARISTWVKNRVLALTYTAWDLEHFGSDLGYDGPPFTWDEDRRFLIRCELDAAFFHLYLGTESKWRESGSKELLEYFPTPRRAVEYIMETFPIVKRKDIARTADANGEHGRYITKDTILDIYDKMAAAQETIAAATTDAERRAAAYQTVLDPPPGPPTDEAGNFIPYAKWTPEIHARYANIIHPPKAAPKTDQELEVLQTGHAILDTLTFVYACDVERVDRLFLEVGLLLMRNDALRKRVAAEGMPTGVGSAAVRPRINQMDQFLQEIGPGAGDELAIDASSGIQMIGIGAEAPSLDDILARNVGKQAWERAQEAVVAAKRIQEHCSSVEECLDALGVANASAFSIG